jgi:basic amino acid/polyamine antiporter, APA family
MTIDDGAEQTGVIHPAHVSGLGGASSMEAHQRAVELIPRLGLFDATMLVMNGIIGTGIFVVPQLVAQLIHTPLMILSVWFLGGIVAICGALVCAELCARFPEVGGQYAYMREAYHPLVAFLFGWTLLLVMQTGATAAVAMIFGRYFVDITRVPVTEGVAASFAIAVFAVVNCFGIRAGSVVQNVFMMTKIVVILSLGGVGLFFASSHAGSWGPALSEPLSGHLLTTIGAAMVPVLFTYAGWATAGFVSSEVRNPRRNMPRATVLGVIGVILLYCLVTFVDLRVLGAASLANSPTPASAVVRVVFGEWGAGMIGVGIMIAALGYISQASLTAPRVYYAMAKDGLFFKRLAWLPERTRAPVLAILLQAVFSIAIALSGRYDQILTYVMSVEFIFFCLTGVSVFIFRARAAQAPEGEADRAAEKRICEMPGHPYTTLIFTLTCAAVTANMIYVYPINSLIGLGILLAGVPAYFVWQKRNSRPKAVSIPGVTLSP